MKPVFGAIVDLNNDLGRRCRFGWLSVCCQGRHFNPELLSWHFSGAVSIVIILGGIGHLRGALIGAFALLQEFFHSEGIFGAFAEHWQLGLGISIIASVALLRRGLVGVPGQWKEQLVGRASRRPAEFLDRPAGLLSQGQKRRPEIAMCLATAPQVLWLDEPLAGMGAGETERMLELLHQLTGSHAILLFENDMDAAFRAADRITVRVNGAVIASGTPEFVRTNAEVQSAYLGDQQHELLSARGLSG